ncbi:MAG TPA: ATP-binding protein [Streptosporangiaceae bacterium]|nr:ATP-binding protein [Streptosporangiaceae bacterium]
MIINLGVSNEHDPGCDGYGTLISHGTAYRCSTCDHNQRSSFVPPRFRKTIDVPAGICDWAADGTCGLSIVGPVGTGKTQLAFAAAVLWLRRTGTWPPLVFRATTLFDSLRGGYSGDQHQTLIGDCQQAPLLVLDDLGAEKPSEWTAERLYEIIDDRYASQRPVIITSNVKTRELAGYTGERVASRLTEMCVTVPLIGDDRRRPGHAA